MIGRSSMHRIAANPPFALRQKRGISGGFPDVRFGSIATEMSSPPHVCFFPDSDHWTDIAAYLKRPNRVGRVSVDSADHDGGTDHLGGALFAFRASGH